MQRAAKRRILAVLPLVAAMLGAGCAASAPSRYFADARGVQTQDPGPALSAYPYAGARDDAIDPWGFIERQCTSYVAWYLNSHGVPFSRVTRGPQATAVFGDAARWDRAARLAGFTVTQLPSPGSIAQWRADEPSPEMPRGGQSITAAVHGHVAVVTAVYPNGLVDTVGYDGRTRSYTRLRTVAPRYILFSPPVRSAPH